MSDHSKPIGNPPPTNIEGEQSGQDQENLTFSDIIKCCYEVDMLVQQAENRASMLRNEHVNNVPQLSDDDKQELIKLFERVATQSQSMADSLKSYCPLPTVVPTTATHTDEFSPKVTIPNSKSSSSGNPGFEEIHKSDSLEKNSSDVTDLGQKEAGSDLSIDSSHTDNCSPRATTPDSEFASSGDLGVEKTDNSDGLEQVSLDVIDQDQKEADSDLPIDAAHTDDLSPKVTTPEPASSGDLGVGKTPKWNGLMRVVLDAIDHVAATPTDEPASPGEIAVEKTDNSDGVDADKALVNQVSTTGMYSLFRPADGSQTNVFSTLEGSPAVAAAPQDHTASGQKMADIPAGSKVENQFAEGRLLQSFCVALENSGLCDSPLPDTGQHAEADEQEVTDPVQKGVIMQDKSEDQDKAANLKRDSSAVPDQKEANVVDTSAATTEPCMEAVLYDQKNEISAPPVVETSSDSEEEQEDMRSYDFAQLPYSEKHNFIKQLLLATLPYFLSAIEDVRSGRRQPQNAHFNEPITTFLKFVKKAKNDKKTKDGFKNFKPITFIEQQYAKSRVSKKNELLYDTLGTYLSQKKYEQPIIELLYYFSEKKFLGAVPAESTMGNLMSGLEHYFFFHVVEWLKGYWRQSFEDYVERQEAILRDLTSKVLPNRYRPRRKLPDYKKTPFFRARVMAHSKLVAVSPAMFMIQKAYALLHTTKVESKILDSDIDFLKTNCTKCDEDNIALEYELFSEIFSTNDSVLQF